EALAEREQPLAARLPCGAATRRVGGEPELRGVGAAGGERALHEVQAGAEALLAVGDELGRRPPLARLAVARVNLEKAVRATEVASPRVVGATTPARAEVDVAGEA